MTEREAVLPQASGISMGGSGEEITILVVEDSPVQAETLRRLLVRHGFNVAVARNGKEGLVKVRETKPTIVITDVLMPEMNGYDLCRQIKGEAGIGDIPVILLTTLSEPDNIIKGLECGANNFVTKPYEDEFILSRIKYVLANHYLRSVTRSDMAVEILFGHQKYCITSDRLQILDLLFSSYETAINKNRELEERNMELEMLYALASAISPRMDADCLFRKVLEVMTGTGMFSLLPKGAIFLVEGETLRLDSHLGVLPCMSGGNRFLRFGECLCGQAAQTGELLVAADSHQDGRHLPLSPETEPHGHFIVPLQSKTKVLGVLCLYTRKGAMLDDHRTKTLVAAGYQIGMAIERMRTDEEIRRLNEELTLKVKERTDQLIEAQEELVRKEKLSVLGQLCGSVGHELRNPLGVMSNAVYFLQMVHGEGDETTNEYLDMIKQEIDNSQRIISDLLDFARTKTPQIKTVTAKELVEESIGRCAIPDGVTLLNQVSETLPPLRVDPLQIGQVLQNLITNGIEAMSAGGTVCVRAREMRGSSNEAQGTYEQGLESQTSSPEPSENFLAISVEDNGEGISEENMRRLFQPLFTTKTKGIGLGLVVCRNLVEANGGRIEVESKVNERTVFTLILPVITTNPGQGEAI